MPDIIQDFFFCIGNNMMGIAPAYLLIIEPLEILPFCILFQKRAEVESLAL